MDNNARRRIAILGSTGSIGTQTVDVLSRYSNLFKAELLTANSNVDLLCEQALRLRPANVVICDKSKYEPVRSRLEGSGIGVHAGMDAVCDLVAAANIDTVVPSMVGFSGLRSTVAAIRAKGKTIALANKETLVAAGGIVTTLARQTGSPILPVDSEHSAIFQCLQASPGAHLAKIHLTASGGPFRTWSRDKIAAAAAADALKHPNWSMGNKITIDSATMMNKGLEVIEAKWLFDAEPEMINVVVHPESIIHSMVEYDDGAVIAQLGCPDMREPIQYALTFPERLKLNNRKLDFAQIASLHFEAPDLGRFPCLGLAFEALRRKGTAAAAMNAANEVAVDAYLKGRISFYDIAETIEKTMNGVNFAANPSLDDIYAANDEAAAKAREIIG